MRTVLVLLSLLAAGDAAAIGSGKALVAAQAKWKVLRAADHEALRAQLRARMADVIEAKGAFKGDPPDTPIMRILPRAGTLTQTRIPAILADEHAINGHGAAYRFDGPKKPAHFTLLLPVSAHDHLPYREYAASNEYVVTVATRGGVELSRQTVRSAGFGKAPGKIGRDDLITDAKVTLPFDRADELVVSFWPSATSKAGYRSGREIVITRGR